MKKITESPPPRKPFFNVRGWMGWDGIVQGGSAIKTLAISLFVPAQSTRTESFEEALMRLQLTEEDVIKKQKYFQWLFILFFIATIGLFTYAIVMFFMHAYAASLASFGLTALLLAQTFRNHFWWFQMKRRKLGCSIKEWLLEGVFGIRKEVLQK